MSSFKFGYKGENMNFQQLRYAVEIEKTNSITAAAKNLYMGQPNLSKSIKELENELGTVLFHRTAKGMEPTSSGLQFLRYAKDILRQVDELQALYQPGQDDCVRFSISVPRATYIADAFAHFLSMYKDMTSLDVQYRETNSSEALSDAAVGDSQLSILRYQKIYESHFSGLIAQNRLVSEVIVEYPMVLLMSKKHPLASQDDVPYHALENYTQIVHGDIQIPKLPLSQLNKGAGRGGTRRIYVYDRGSLFELLRKVEGSYMWVSPFPQAELDRHDLTQKTCKDAGINQDVAVWRASTGLSQPAKQFLEQLKQSLKNGFEVE